MNKAVQTERYERATSRPFAYVQTESWKAAFKKIVPADLLSKCTQLERATAMYKRLLAEQKGNGYMLELGWKTGTALPGGMQPGTRTWRGLPS